MKKTRAHFAKSINELKDVERIRAILRNKPRDLLLFDLVTQTGIPIKHLLQLRVKDLRNVQIGQSVPVGSNRLGDGSLGLMNELISRTLQKYLEDTAASDGDYVFRSRKGSKALSLSSVSRMVRGWFKMAGFTDVGGALSLRRSWQYHHRDGVDNRTAGTKNDGAEVLSPVNVKTTQQTVFEELEKAIVSGRIMPGKPLVIEEIARQMGVSRIPVREAFGRLEARGFITTLPKRGSVVNELSVEQLKEIIEIRIVNESIAARKAVTNCDEETLKQLKKLHKQWIVALSDNDVEQLLYVNREFHHTLYKRAEMPILQTLIEYLWDRMSPYLHILLRLRDNPDPITDIRMHEGILNAVERADPKGVVKWLKADLRDGADLTIGLFTVYRKSRGKGSVFE